MSVVTFWNQVSHIHHLNHGLNAGNFWQSLMKLPSQWVLESLKFTPDVFRCQPDAQKGLSPPEDLRQEKNTTLLRSLVQTSVTPCGKNCFSFWSPLVAPGQSRETVSTPSVQLNPRLFPRRQMPNRACWVMPLSYNLSTGIYGAPVNRPQLQRRLENREDNIQLYARKCENRSDMTVL